MDRQHHETEECKGWQLQPEVVPWGRSQIVQQAAFYGASLRVAVVGAQPDVDGDDAENVGIHDEQGAQVIIPFCSPSQQNGNGKGDNKQQAVGEEKDEEGDARVSLRHGRGDKSLDAGCKDTEVNDGASPVLALPQRNERDNAHHGAEMQRQIILPRAVCIGKSPPKILADELQGDDGSKDAAEAIAAVPG